ncbi:MAG: 6-phosphogluconolactonase [Candidatus Zapsychrus exili]|nr:6-phosphogluconolactonase [Candidatus Zapsychrus exili]
MSLGINKKILVFEDTYTLTNHLIQKFFDVANQSIEKYGKFFVALTGGSTVVEFYSKLSGIKDFSVWKNTHIFLTDERFVSKNSKDSNLKLIKDNLLDFVNIPPQNVHPINTEEENAFLAAQTYEEELRHVLPIVNELPKINFILLGLGSDGHIASLFPTVEGIDNQEVAVIATYPEYLKTDRVSLTMSVINNADCVVFFIKGAHKARMVKKILEEKQDLPATRVSPVDGELLFLLDKQSAKDFSSENTFENEGDAIRVLIN